MDTENKSRGSLIHFFPQARKSNIQQAHGLDEFVNVLDEGAPGVLADMGAGAGEVCFRDLPRQVTNLPTDMTLPIGVNRAQLIEFADFVSIFIFSTTAGLPEAMALISA